MKSKKIRNPLILLLTALIWGAAFVAQSTGGDAVGPFSFNCVRCIIGGFVLIPVIILMDKLGISRKPETKKDKKNLIFGGISCGIVLGIATDFQQFGITAGTPAGKAGFLTACYILLVPIIGIFLKKKCPINVWIGVAITLIGLYFLCIDGSLTLQNSDVLVMICALTFAIHILVIDHFTPLVDGVRMSCIQFFVAGILSSVPMFLSDMGGSFANLGSWLAMFESGTAWISILYAGVMSCGVAYTLQIIGQEGVNPTIASLILSLESVFSVITSAIILKEMMNGRELMGCMMIFIAVILAQLPPI